MMSPVLKELSYQSIAKNNHWNIYLFSSLYNQSASLIVRFYFYQNQSCLLNLSNVEDYMRRNELKKRYFETFDAAFAAFSCPYDVFVYYRLLYFVCYASSLN